MHGDALTSLQKFLSYIAAIQDQRVCCCILSPLLLEGLGTNKRKLRQILKNTPGGFSLSSSPRTGEREAIHP